MIKDLPTNANVNVTNCLIKERINTITEHLKLKNHIKFDAETRKRIDPFNDMAIYVIDEGREPRVIISLTSVAYGHQQLYTYLNGYPEDNIFDLKNGVKFTWSIERDGSYDIDTAFMVKLQPAEREYFEGIIREHIEKMFELLETTTISSYMFNCYDSYKGIVTVEDTMLAHRFGGYPWSDYPDIEVVCEDEFFNSAEFINWLEKNVHGPVRLFLMFNQIESNQDGVNKIKAMVRGEC